MCKICEAESITIKDKPVIFGKLKAGINISLYIEEDKLMAVLDNHEGTLIDSVTYKMKYCPNCGKKLSK